jgi:hypothetical protein
MTRRRILIAAAVVGVVAVVVTSLPSGDGLGHSQPTGPPQAVPKQPTEVPLTAANRRGINRTLDEFVPLAVRREDPQKAFALTTTTLHGTAKPADWKGGTMPVLAYPAVGKHFHGWRLDFAYPRQVELELELHPPDHSKLGLIAFSVGLKKQHGRWLVDTFTPAATFQPAGTKANIQAEPDFSPKAKASPHSGSPLSQRWQLLPILLFGAPLFAAAALGVVALVRWRMRRPAPAESLDDYYQRLGGR